MSWLMSWLWSTAVSAPVVLAAGDGGFVQVIADPTFWVAVAFLIFVALLLWKVRAPLIGALDSRAAKIKNDLDEAQRLREEAQALLAEYQRKQRDAISETEDMVAHAGEQAKRARQKAEEDLAAALKRREQQALDRIAIRLDTRSSDQLREAALTHPDPVMREQALYEYADRNEADAIDLLAHAVVTDQNRQIRWDALWAI